VKIDHKKALKIMETVCVTEYGIQFKIYDLWIEDKCKLVSIDSFPMSDIYTEEEIIHKLQYKREGSKYPEKWITYDDCIYALFSLIKGKKLKCSLTISYKDMMGEVRIGGGSTRLIFELPMAFMKEIKNFVESKYHGIIEHQYEEHLQAQKDKWINSVIKRTVGK